MQLQRIEEAALNAWPALQQLLYDGWVVRFANGYTKRANSVTPLYPATGVLAAKVAFCEGLYRARGLPPVFRLASFAAPPGLDELLAERGYQLLDETLVLARQLTDAPWGFPYELTLQTLPIDRWLPLYTRLSGASLAQEQTHRAMLEAIPARRSQFALFLGEEPVACGLGVLEGECFGLFDIVTSLALRGRGYGTHLVGGMLAWAGQQGGQLAYLQVVGANAPARRLYGKLGFAEAYRYWYRAS